MVKALQLSNTLFKIPNPFVKLYSRKKNAFFLLVCHVIHNGTTVIVLSQLKFALKKGHDDKLLI